jgi:predicted phosphodiesterase
MVAIAHKTHRSLRSWVGGVPAVRIALGTIIVSVSCIALAFGGIWLGLRVASAGTYPSALGSASFKVELSSHGRVEVFIPLADWGLRAHAFSAPVTLHVEPRVLNRQALIAAASGNDALLRRTLKDLAHDGSLALRRALRYMIVGVLIAAAFAWGVLRIYHCRRRRLLIGVPAAIVIIGLVTSGGLLWQIRSSWNGDALSHPTYYARGAELIQLLNAAQHASAAHDSYVSKVEGALSGFASLLSNPSAGEIGDGGRALLVSDLHDNTLVLGSLSFYAQGQPVFFDGDFGNSGDRTEINTLVPRITRLGTKVIAVSGNHDSGAMMLALARHGAIVLTSHGQLLGSGHYGPASVVVDRLRIAGFEDPLEYDGTQPDAPGRIFSFGQLPDPNAAIAPAEARLLRWFRSLTPAPDVVLVHQNMLAQFLARTLWAQGYSKPLTILTGHDHIQHVNHAGPITVVDAGTVGAGGVYGIGSAYVGLGQLHFGTADRGLEATDLIQIEPVSGVAQAERVVVDQQCATEHLDCTAGVDYMDPHQGPKTDAVNGLKDVSPLASAGVSRPAGIRVIESATRE